MVPLEIVTFSNCLYIFTAGNFCLSELFLCKQVNFDNYKRF